MLVKLKQRRTSPYTLRGDYNVCILLLVAASMSHHEVFENDDTQDQTCSSDVWVIETQGNTEPRICQRADAVNEDTKLVFAHGTPSPTPINDIIIERQVTM